jgi:microsomal dipeptidase-like Zn-dependent dipeptidase
VAPVSERARKLHQGAFVFDAHVHVINRQFYQGGDIDQRFPNEQVDWPRAREGGLDAMFFSLFVAESYYPGRCETKQALRLADLALRQLEKNRDVIELALNAPDIEGITQRWKMAAVLREDHVALGSDFDDGPTLPIGMRDIRDLPMLTDAMLRRGCSEQRIGNFLGGNLLRVFRQITEKT